MRDLIGPRLLMSFVIVLMLLALACGSQGAPTSASNSDPISRTEAGALIEESVKAAVEQALVPTDENVSRQELRETISELVSNAVADSLAETNSITKTEVAQLIRAEIASLQQAQSSQTIPVLEESKPTIVFSGLGWSSARLQNQIAMFIVEHGFGYPVDQISGETQVLWDNLLDGDSLVTMEVWLPNQQEDWDAAVFEGTVTPLGKSLDKNWQGFVVPTYLADRRNLKTVQDIIDEDHIDLFVESGKEFERPKKAFLVTCPIGTECQDINQAKIVAYAMDNRVEFSVPDSFSELVQSLELAYAAERPWVGYMWGPSRLSQELDLTILEEPEFTEDCWETTKGCAYPTAQVLVAVHPSMLSIAPDVVEFLRKWDFTANRQTITEKWMVNNDATLEEAAIFFLNRWPQVWTEWVPEDVAQRIQQAVALGNEPTS